MVVEQCSLRTPECRMTGTKVKKVKKVKKLPKSEE